MRAPPPSEPSPTASTATSAPHTPTPSPAATPPPDYLSPEAIFAAATEEAIANAIKAAVKAGSIPRGLAVPHWDDVVRATEKKARAAAAGAAAPGDTAADPSAAGDAAATKEPRQPPPGGWRDPKAPRSKIAARLRSDVAGLHRDARGLHAVYGDFVADTFGDWLLAQYVARAREMTEASETGLLTLEQLGVFTKALVTLQRGQHNRQKLILEAGRLEVSRESTGKWMEAQFRDFIQSDEARALMKPPLSAEESERRINEIFGYEGTPEHIMRKARQQVRAADKASAQAMVEVLAKGGSYEAAEAAGHAVAAEVIEMRIKDPVLWSEYSGVCDAPILEELQAMGITDPDLLSRAKPGPRPGRKLPGSNPHMYTLEGDGYKPWE